MYKTTFVLEVAGSAGECCGAWEGAPRLVHLSMGNVTCIDDVYRIPEYIRR